MELTHPCLMNQFHQWDTLVSFIFYVFIFQCMCVISHHVSRIQSEFLVHNKNENFLFFLCLSSPSIVSLSLPCSKPPTLFLVTFLTFRTKYQQPQFKGGEPYFGSHFVEAQSLHGQPVPRQDSTVGRLVQENCPHPNFQEAETRGICAVSYHAPADLFPLSSPPSQLWHPIIQPPPESPEHVRGLGNIICPFLAPFILIFLFPSFQGLSQVIGVCHLQAA